MEHSKEVLDWARQKWAEADALEKKNWEAAFPELKESEDERIIMELEDFVRLNCGPGQDEYKRVEEWCYWLEKQKEQRPADIAPNQFDGITYGMSGASTEHSKEWSEDEKIMSDIIFAIKEVWMEADADRMIAYLERHKEPFIIHDTGCSKRGAKMPEYCLDVKPAEWSEEDKTMCKHCRLWDAYIPKTATEEEKATAIAWQNMSYGEQPDYRDFFSIHGMATD